MKYFDIYTGKATNISQALYRNLPEDKARKLAHDKGYFLVDAGQKPPKRMGWWIGSKKDIK